MRRFYHTLFWILTFVILTLTFGRTYGGLAKSFYFVAFLFPIILGTSYLVTSYLVPRFLLKKAYFKFVLYFIYTLVFSVYLEMLVMTLSLIIFANFQYSELNPKTTDIVFLTVVLYFFVFLNTIIFLIKEYFRGEERLPDNFLRIHRSILVNRDKVQSYNREVIIVGEKELPISRKYKGEVMGILDGSL